MSTIAKIFLLTLITLCFAIGVSAATFVVNTTTDTADAIAGDGSCADAGSNCSFRAAISEANALAGPDIITLGAVIYTQTLGPSGESLNAGGDWDIKSDLTINGAGEATTILQGIGCTTGRDRVLDIAASGITVTLNNLTVRNGCLATVAPGVGAGIWNNGNLILNNVTVSDNKVQNFEGGAAGGGIYNSGSGLTLTGTTVTNNLVTNGLFQGSAGGGIASFSTGPVVITDSNISGNHANSTSGPGSGGGMYAGKMTDLTITNSHFDNNEIQGTNDNGGGGLYVLSDTGLPGDNLNISKSTFNNNTSTGTNSSGVGIYITTAVDFNVRLDVNIDQTTISGNSGSGDGAGMQVLPSIGNLYLHVGNSTISNNISGSRGGGINLGNTGAAAAQILAYFTNTTISGNSATQGGGLMGRSISGGISANFDFCTITNNTASVRGGGIADAVNGISLDMWRTVVSENNAPTGKDFGVTSTVTSLDYNHFGDTTGVIIGSITTHNTTGNAMLGALADNGGPTLTHKPDAGSPLVDAIPTGQYNCSTIFVTPIFADQRGFTRPFGNGCDKGAVERGSTLAAGPWTLSGTVKTTTGIPIRNVAVTISGGNLPAPITVFTGNLGTYQFTNLPGLEYTVMVTAKRYHFNDSIVVFSLGSNITNADFIANAPFEREVLQMEFDTVKRK